MYTELLDALVTSAIDALHAATVEKGQPLHYAPGETIHDSEDRACIALDMLQGALLDAVLASATPQDMTNIVRYFRNATGAQIPIRGTIREDGVIEWNAGENPYVTANGSQ